MPPRRLTILITAILAVAACGTTRRTPSAMASLDHVIVIYQENWSFDGLFGKFPGANGIANASPTSLAQTGKTGNTTDILELIATRWGLAPLGARDAAQDGLTGAF